MIPSQEPSNPASTGHNKATPTPNRRRALKTLGLATAGMVAATSLETASAADPAATELPLPDDANEPSSVYFPLTRKGPRPPSGTVFAPAQAAPRAPHPASVGPNASLYVPYTIPGSDFKPARNTYAYNSTNGGITANAGTFFRAGVYLPQGSVITTVYAAVQDNTSTGSQLELDFYVFNSANSSTITNYFSSFNTPSPNYRYLNVPIATPVVVDNSSRLYELYVYFNGNNQALQSVLIYYIGKAGQLSLLSTSTRFVNTGNGTGGYTGTIGGSTQTFSIAGQTVGTQSIPADARAVVGTLTVYSPGIGSGVPFGGGGYASIGPGANTNSGSGVTTTYQAGQVYTSGAFVSNLDSDGKLGVYSNYPCLVTVDLTGYYQ